MLARLLALFLIVPAIELALLIRLGDAIGFWPTVGIIVVTGVAGSFLARREGSSAWRRFNAQLASGGLPGKELLDGVIILCAGALLITPGVLTDVVGLLGLLPPTRALMRKAVRRRLDRAMARGSLRFGTFGGAEWAAPEAPEDDPSWEGRGAERPQHQRPAS